MFNPSREQVRQFFIEIWKKHSDQQIMTDIERIALGWMLEHPEYENYYSEKFLEKDFSVEMGEPNPFLHLSMHLAIEEQIRTNQPPGIQNAFIQLQQKHGDGHQAAHELFDCLAEQIYQNQKNNTEFSSANYLHCIHEKINKGSIEK